MTSTLDHALALAADGFHVFPLQAGRKMPPKDMHFKTEATRDPTKLKQWFADRHYNIGIYTGKFGDDAGLLVIDVDNKGVKNGNRELLRLEMQGLDLPATREHSTPTGGRHLFFRVPEPLKQGVNVLGPGLDTRSSGGYVVGPGSTVQGKEYAVSRRAAIEPVPAWVAERCGRAVDRTLEPGLAPEVQLDAQRAVSRAIDYLTTGAPIAVKGGGGDATTYSVAARVKDFGVDAETCWALMLEHWNVRSPPGWSPERLREKVQNAYAYGNKPVGASAPEAELTPVVAAPSLEKPSDAKPDLAEAVGHPFENLNKEFAFCLAGGGSHILWETTDSDDNAVLEHLNTGAFHAKFAAKKIQVGKKSSPITEEWMQWGGRRSYDGLVFMPLKDAPKRFYNLWRGFAVEPWPADVPPSGDAKWAVEAWMTHIRENVANGDPDQARWLIDFFAHLVQRPWEKPLVAPVLKGGKGVGKNATFAPLAYLLGNHAITAANKRYLIGNFNGYLEHTLLLVLDEAFWSGDKQAEGILKDLITGTHHVIEHKGKEPYKIKNLARIAVLGNEDWLIPASNDERRFAVFDVGDGRKQDATFFETIKERMLTGGHSYLLRCLQDVKIQKDINRAPATGGLLEQKHASLEPFHQWWLACLEAGALVCGEFGDAWTQEIGRDRFRNAFARYTKERQIKSRLPDDKMIGRQMNRVCPGLESGRNRKDGYLYRLPDLDAARAGWDAFIGHKVEWAAR